MSLRSVPIPVTHRMQTFACAAPSYIQRQGAKGEDTHHAQHQRDPALDARLASQALLREFVHASAELQGRCQECTRAEDHEEVSDAVDADHARAPQPRHFDVMQGLTELADREPEADHGERRPDPAHQCALRGPVGPFDRQGRTFVREGCAYVGRVSLGFPFSVRADTERSRKTVQDSADPTLACRETVS